MQLVGHLIKTLKLVRDFMAVFRDALLDSSSRTWAADELFDAFIRFWTKTRRPGERSDGCWQGAAACWQLRRPRSLRARSLVLPSAVLSAAAEVAWAITNRREGPRLGWALRGATHRRQ
jgi:hypothetical protein